MLQLKQLLDRFKNLSNNEKTKKQIIINILNKNKLPIKIEQISISKNTIFIKTQPIIKTEIVLRKEKILKEIKETHGLESITILQ
ncbi:MAG: hypothetical protein COV32_03005 [Candidatus Yonathbacteria bacterium CG10_big_fil_rev_8_21_14_0_10_43_136]|uniref:DUF721 domain-containing protein n=1 Tax=Candidatus Yonathbacteria bacterium CG_4_10_14_0_8_um_filter_43_17 TaxID=1975099 RepID=A0A2M7Q6G8_9BACT|nr:MAG: hypothetical protein COW60_02955 [Candidatus Yonathbacteria bacterium CG17_big_fil_post_rev_8_21_14_2_50_43_9]PIR40531.1 MAG: hypothetical protein COV32_03005 [Candidatus Yonathbacteria bacterium CG10_big_fil_rev_8_21_14_0_10_43_136]PIX57303.1 MAG: hypothetical protein COZ48_01510 [Candidatus Yonathbacteria bacterium CG_4_10_14_3_um_filter_43_12]PIY58670.1 MAG: hypothetical protein COY98_00775 [Candidatus Yonathbacteria bacterium CG_4_10_14_0_8_um_filter_43_17]PJC21818.1 MAG: hypothetic